MVQSTSLRRMLVSLGFRLEGMLHASSDPTQRWSAGVPYFLNPGQFLSTRISRNQRPALLTSLGGGHVCAIRYNSSLECWGDNSFGQLDIPAPATGFVAIAAGFTQSCGIKYNTTLVCWGGNYANNDGEAVVPLPVTGYVAVAAGTQHTCAIRSDTTLICFGNAPGFAYPSQPETGIIAVSCGDCQTAALRVNTSLLYTAIGDAQGNQPKAYDIPPPNSGFAGVYAGDAQTCAIKSDSSFECWGNAFYGDSDVYNQLKDVQPLPGFGAPCLFQ